MSHAPTIALICVASTLPLAACAATGDSGKTQPPSAVGATTVASGTAFRATGNEPSWRLDVGPAEMSLLTDFGQTRTVASAPTVAVDGTTRTFTGRTARGDMIATVVDRVCVDSMSGMPHPQTVTVAFGGKKLAGCGGEPASLLQGAVWTVLEIGGTPTVPGSQVTMQFAADGRLSGQASCNRFNSEYALSGEGLAISPAATTRMMCDPPLMDQERRFVAALGGVAGFSIADDGALLLRAGNGTAVKAHRR